MEFTEDSDRWRLIFKDGVVQQLKVDYRLGFMLADDTDKLDLYIGTLFQFKDGELNVSCGPEDPATLAPVLALANQSISEIEINKSGSMTVRFTPHRSIEIHPHAAYEAWELGSSMGFLFVCSPGGGVTYFKDEKRMIK